MQFVVESLYPKKLTADDVRVDVVDVYKKVSSRFVNKNYHNFQKAAHRNGYLIKKFEKDIIIVYPKCGKYGSINIKGYKYPLPVIFAKEQRGILKKFLYTDTTMIRKALGDRCEK